MYKEEQLTSLLCGRRILIAGYGREGKSTERLVKGLLPHADITIVEGNDNIRGEATRGYDMIIKSPGIPMFVFEAGNGEWLCPPDHITSQTDLFLQVYGSQTVGITGTKGKSTTTTLLYSILRKAAEERLEGTEVLLAGNMGIPLFDIIPQIDGNTTIVAEFSCHQMENIHRAPHTAILLNLFQEHLDHYHSYLDYKMAKMQIALKQRSGDYFFYCADNAELAELVELHRGEMAGHVSPYTLSSELGTRLKTLPSQLCGDHNISNMEAAYLAARSLGANEQVVFDTIAAFKGLEHRMELVGTYAGVTFYNDSISTIPAACMAAVVALKEVDTLILGGFDRGIDYEELGRFLAHCPIRNLVFVGAAGGRIREAYEKAKGTGRNTLRENDYTAIVEWCFAHTQKGKICLLSPAAASYDAFKNFEERGRVFKRLVSSYHS